MQAAARPLLFVSPTFPGDPPPVIACRAWSPLTGRYALLRYEDAGAAVAAARDLSAMCPRAAADVGPDAGYKFKLTHRHRHSHQWVGLEGCGLCSRSRPGAPSPVWDGGLRTKRGGKKAQKATAKKAKQAKKPNAGDRRDPRLPHYGTEP